MDRRQFIISSCAVCGIAVVGGSLLDSCKKKTTSAPVNFTLDLTSSSNAALNTIGGSVYSNNVIVIRTASALSSASFAALSDVCTHAGCTVAYSKGSLVCPCHGGTFDLKGNVLAGPPPNPLAKYTTTLSGNILTIAS